MGKHVTCREEVASGRNRALAEGLEVGGLLRRGGSKEHLGAGRTDLRRGWPGTQEGQVRPQ